jgi:hypothetical protein
MRVGDADMSAVPVHVALTDSVHVALSCVTNTAGQTVCTNSSDGFLAGFGVLIIFYLAILVLSIVAAVKVVTKAGYSGWWVLITFVPLVGAVFVLMFAFSTWPVTREVQMLRAQLAEQRGYGGRRGTTGDWPEPGQPPQGGTGLIPPGAPAADYSPGGQAALPTIGAFITEGKTPVVTPPGVAPTAATPVSELPPPGWYPNPADAAGQLRYWDGTAWTDNVQSPQ